MKPVQPGLPGKSAFSNRSKGGLVEFRLSYSGQLPGGGSDLVRVKHSIRQVLHPQIRDLCQRSYLLGRLTEEIRGHTKVYDDSTTALAALGTKYRLAGFEFVPIIVGAIDLCAHLDVLFLRREPPGSLITKRAEEYGGDLDNRLKIFFDALRAPCEAKEVPKNAQPGDGEQPFYCLLEDDSLITKFQVESDTLLGETTPERQKDVQLIVRVAITATQKHIRNLELTS